MDTFDKKKDICNKAFDWDLYWKDIDSGVNHKTLLKRLQGHRYYVYKSKMEDVKS